MKKNILICFVFILVLALVAVFLLCRNSKPLVINYIYKHHTELEQFAESIIVNNHYNMSSTYNGWEVYYWQENDMVEFVVRRRGIVSASTYEGFYYSPDDRPIGFQGRELEFTEGPDGWRWEEIGGDNWNYTEKVAEKWYWFKMSF